MKPLEDYCNKALELGVDGAKQIEPCSVVTAEWVRMKCQFGCSGFGLSLCLEIEMFLDGYYKAWSMGSGPCRLCKECDLSTPCRHGYEARPSMEACGIDVFKTARDNGFSIEVVKTHEDERNVFGVILAE